MQEGLSNGELEEVKELLSKLYGKRAVLYRKSKKYLEALEDYRKAEEFSKNLIDKKVYQIQRQILEQKLKSSEKE